MSPDAEKRPQLPFASRASENDSWLRLMITNPMNGVMSTFSNEIVELRKQDNRKEETDQWSDD